MSNWTSGRYTVRVGGFAPPPSRTAADPAEAARHGREADALRLAGDLRGADRAIARQIRALAADPTLRAAAEALEAERFAEAERLGRGVAAQRPADALAYWIVGEAASRAGQNAEAERWLAQGVARAPDLPPLRHAYAMVLYWRHKTAETLAETKSLLAADPENPVFLHLSAICHLRLGEDAEAVAAYALVLQAHPNAALTWMSYGHALKTVGRQADAVAAYRRALDLRPDLGEAWWSLANLKTVKLTATDIAAMEAALAEGSLAPVDRLQLLFALGKAHEDARNYQAAFDRYADGAALQRGRLAYDRADARMQTGRLKAFATPEMFAARAGQGCRRADPIFVLGLPRSGSTLIEQILASHSQVEGTSELPYIPNLANRLAGPARRETEGAYPDVLAALSGPELAALGEEYLDAAQAHRKTDRPFFIDKLPNNWPHVGLIHLILPNAKIIDARRHPLGCAFSVFKQFFAAGQAFSYDLADIGAYYRDYVELMAHMDAVLPGRVHRVIYEALVDDPEHEVRRLLAACGLGFEPGCLKFYENERSVRTVSSEQVRQPIFKDATDHWRNFEPWLGPLKAELGDVLDAYPNAPAFPSPTSRPS